MISTPPKTKKMRTVKMKKVKLSHPNRAKQLQMVLRVRKTARRRATLVIKITSIV